MAVSFDGKRIDSTVNLHLDVLFLGERLGVGRLDGGTAANGCPVLPDVLAFLGPRSGDTLGVALLDLLDEVGGRLAHGRLIGAFGFPGIGRADLSRHERGHGSQDDAGCEHKHRLRH